jgi:hypothetical protein
MIVRLRENSFTIASTQAWSPLSPAAAPCWMKVLTQTVVYWRILRMARVMSSDATVLPRRQPSIAYVLENPLVMFAVHPSIVGRTGRVVLGKKSGKLSINYKLAELGLGELDDQQNSAA